MCKAIQTGVRTLTPLADEKDWLCLWNLTRMKLKSIVTREEWNRSSLTFLANAIKFTEKGEIKIKCHVENGRVVTQVIGHRYWNKTRTYG